MPMKVVYIRLEENDVRWLRVYAAYMNETVPGVVQRIIAGFRERVERGRRGRGQAPLLGSGVRGEEKA